jgi:hypothetical protein
MEVVDSFLPLRQLLLSRHDLDTPISELFVSLGRKAKGLAIEEQTGQRDLVDVFRWSAAHLESEPVTI